MVYLAWKSGHGSPIDSLNYWFMARQGKKPSLPMGGAVIWNQIPFETPVIPAKAEIQSVVGAFPMAGGVDSRFRGNDRTR